MAFGRDGSELELYVFDMQNRVMRDTLDTIIEISSEQKVKSLAKDALKRIGQIEKRLEE